MLQKKKVNQDNTTCIIFFSAYPYKIQRERERERERGGGDSSIILKIIHTIRDFRLLDYADNIKDGYMYNIHQ